MFFRALKPDQASEARRRGAEAAKLLEFPEERDARINYLTRQLADLSITKTERTLSRRECELLTQARDAERRAAECAERRRQHDVMWAAFSKNASIHG